MRRSRSIFGFDIFLLFSIIALVVIGIIFIYSSGITSTGINVSNEYLKQIFWSITGLFLLILISNLNITLLKNLAFRFYILNIIILIITLSFGKVVNGARSWIGVGFLGIQPSEFMKISYILFYSYFLDINKKNIKDLTVFVKSLFIMIVPFILILLQPDMGTAMVFIPIFLFIYFLAGGNIKYFLLITITGIVSIYFIFLSPWAEFIAHSRNPFIIAISDWQYLRYILMALFFLLTISFLCFLFLKKKYFEIISYIFSILIISFSLAFGSGIFLKDYQLMRLIIFLDPQVDPKGAGWNIIQSMTAIGSGGFRGKGFLQGTQSHYRFLPQQSTDFIFSIISEEWGFIGCLIIFALFGIIIFRSLTILTYAADKFSVFVGSGVIGMYFFHFMVNIGMTVGIMPITGIPLVFLSYGGSSLWTSMICAGLLMSIYNHRFRN